MELGNAILFTFTSQKNYLMEGEGDRLIRKIMWLPLATN